MTPVSSSTDWQLAVGATGAIVEGVDDVAQCLRIIVLTPKGSVPSDPDFGTDLIRYLDRPLPVARPQIIREILDAVARCEPRVTVASVSVDQVDGAPGTVALSIEWSLVNGAASRSTLVSLGVEPV